MLETNVFRTFMMVGSVVVIGIVLTLFFTAPMVDIDASARENYEAVMQVELPDDKEKLTAYEAVMYSVQAKPRGDVRHY